MEFFGGGSVLNCVLSLDELEAAALLLKGDNAASREGAKWREFGEMLVRALDSGGKIWVCADAAPGETHRTRVLEAIASISGNPVAELPSERILIIR